MNSSLKRTIVTTFCSPSNEIRSGYDDGEYVLHVSCGETSPWLSRPLTAALSDQSIQVYDLETLQCKQKIKKAHNAPITDLCHAGNDSLVVSSGKDGLVKIFDVRVAAQSLQALDSEKHDSCDPVLHMETPKREQALSISLGYSDSLLAVGGDKGNIHFFDLRNGSATKLLGSYVDAHTDEVTRVRFQKAQQSPLLLSASEDGLVCVHDTSQPNEEQAVVSVMNVMSPLREVGFFGSSGEGLFCITGSETLSVWHHSSAQRICDFGSVREPLSLSCGFTIDYQVGCFWDGVNLNLLAGSCSGDAAIFQVDAGSISLSRKLYGGHKGCLRATAFLSNNMGNRMLVTGGEDARICEWYLDDMDANVEPICNTTTSYQTKSTGSPEVPKLINGGPTRRSKSKKNHNPY